jgi:cell division transport system permease protein
MKGFRIFRRNVGYAIKSIFRNVSLSAASVICTTVTLFLVSVAMLMTANINEYTKSLEDTLTITVYVKENATEEQISTIKSKLLEIQNIKSDEILYKDKNTVKKETVEKSDKDDVVSTILTMLGDDYNFLCPEIILTVKDLSKMDETVSTIKTIENIDHVTYYEDAENTMLPIFNAIQKITFVIILGLIIVTIFLISNTVKLTIFARKNEIEIMRLVGNSNFVIRLPFVIEGLFLGFIGSITPIIATIWGYIILFDKYEGHITNFIQLIKPMPLALNVSIVILVIGSLVGMLSSYAAVRKHLKI